MKKQIALMMAALTCITLFAACKKEAKKPEQVQAQTEAMAEPLVGDELEQVKEEVTGRWKSDKNDFNLWIRFEEDVCEVSIDGPTEEGIATWTFSGDLAKLDDYRLVAVNCTKYLNTANEGVFSVYEEGNATILIKDSKLTWIDESEHAADDLIFEKVDN